MPRIRLFFNICEMDIILFAHYSLVLLCFNIVYKLSVPVTARCSNKYIQREKMIACYLTCKHVFVVFPLGVYFRSTRGLMLGPFYALKCEAGPFFLSYRL